MEWHHRAEYIWSNNPGHQPSRGIGESAELVFALYSSAIPTNGLDLYIGSENAPDTYYNGLISNFRWVIGNPIYGYDAPPYPMTPLLPVVNTVLLIGLGPDLSIQLTDVSGTNTITASNVTYNADSGIAGNIDGSIQFGTIWEE